MESLNKSINNISLYEVKLYVRKAQNAVMGLTEMEAKVREATNNEPWGASSSLMQQIAAATYNYREREEIMNMIYRRFTEKTTAEHKHEWRQIYKALQLMEYVIKNGSEKFVDEARANVSALKFLRSFQYIDPQGRDQGINVRNRAKQLMLLLQDEDLIREERKKAKLNLKKFGGVAGGKSSVNPNRRFNSSSAFDEDDGEDLDAGYSGFGGYQNRVFGDGGVYGERYEEERSAGAILNEFEEYEVGSTRRSSRTSKPTTKTTNTNVTLTKNNNEVDLFGLDSNKATPAALEDDDDDDEFDDFQSAAPTPAPTTNANSLAGLFNTTQSNGNILQQYQQPTQTFSAPLPVPGAMPVQPSYNLSQVTPQFTSPVSQPVTPQVAQPKPKTDAFSSLFSTAKTQTTSRSTSTTKPTPVSVTKDDDDFFGSFTLSPAPAPAPVPAQSNTNNDEIDLLSF